MAAFDGRGRSGSMRPMAARRRAATSAGSNDTTAGEEEISFEEALERRTSVYD